MSHMLRTCLPHIMDPAQRYFLKNLPLSQTSIVHITIVQFSISFYTTVLYFSRFYRSMGTKLFSHREELL